MKILAILAFALATSFAGYAVALNRDDTSKSDAPVELIHLGRPYICLPLD